VVDGKGEEKTKSFNKFPNLAIYIWLEPLKAAYEAA
jgi:hypothetical protein